VEPAHYLEAEGRGDVGTDKLLSDSPTGRKYDPSQLLPTSTIESVFRRFRSEVPALFAETIGFGFVFGGAAKGYAVQNQDIDFFICLREEDTQGTKRFQRWYFDLHEEFGLLPDRSDPGEVMTAARLAQKVEYVRVRPVRPVIETYFEYEALVWADVLSGEKAARIGDLNLLESFVCKCEALPQRWRKELLSMAGPSVDIEVAKLPTTRLFRRYVKYLKHGDNSLPLE
jgi:hypothetical protein